MKNLEIRKRAEINGVKLWQIAERLNLNDSNFSRKLRKEFGEEERERILAIIDEIAKEEK